MKVSGRVLGAILAGVAVTLGSATTTAAQDRDIQRKDAYLGINLAERCLEVTEGMVCGVPPVIRSVVVGGPADVAGVRMGDVLVSIDGVAVTTVEGREALFNLVRETPVDLSLVREGLTVDLEVVPAPLARERQVRFLPGWLDAQSLAVKSRTMTIRGQNPAELGFTVEVEAANGDVDEGSTHYVIVQADSTGHTMVRVAMPQGVFVESDNVVDIVHERIRSDAREGDEPEVSYSWRFVLRDAALADRLETARRMTRVGARARIDTLLRMHGALRDRASDSVGAVWVEGDAANAFVSVRAPDLARLARSAAAPEVRKLFEFRNRAAGAEFQELTPQLADYFPGAEAGLLVLRVIPGTPAGRLGLLQGDVVVEIGGERALELTVLRNALMGPARDLDLVVKWIRKGSEHRGTLSYP